MQNTLTTQNAQEMSNLHNLPHVTFEQLLDFHFENERFLNEKFAKTEQLIQENALRMKELQKTVGGWSNSHGSFTEAFFYDCFEEGKKNFFGEKFDKIERNVKGLKIGFHDEYDIVLFNGKSICIIEVQFKAKKEHLIKLFRKANTFRDNFPDYKNHQVYLGFASHSFYKDLERECIANGVAVIKERGETVIINDGYLKVY
jgi:hypothetical protein